jgi:hypothetical protein
VRFPCVHAVATTPAQRLGVSVHSVTQPYQPSPKTLSGRPARRPFRGLLGVHLRYGLHTRAVTVYRDTLSEGFSHFVTSMTAPVASGWSGCRVGFAPTGKRRLSTAHGHCGHGSTCSLPRPVAIDPKRYSTTLGLNLSWLLTGEAATAKYGVIHQIDKAHIAFIKRIMTGWCTGRLCLLAELSVHSEPLLEYGAPIGG